MPGLGEALLAVGQIEQAGVQHAAALDLAAQVGDKYELASAHNGLGCARHAAGDSGQARRHWQEALALYTGWAPPKPATSATIWPDWAAPPMPPHTAEE